MKTITIYTNARTSSHRCKNKLLRPFANTTLIDIALKRLKTLSEKYNVIFAAHEDLLIEKAQQYDVPFYRRSYKSSVAEDNIQDVYEVMGGLESEYVAFFNPCCPFVSVERISEAVDTFLSSDSLSLACVSKAREWMFFQDGNIVLDMSTYNTKTCDYLWQVTHALNIYPRKRFFYDGIIWKGVPNDPELFELNRLESMDVDYEDEFYACEQMYKNIIE